MRKFQLKLKGNKTSSISAVSAVKSPAIEEDFVAFNKDDVDKIKMYSFSEEGEKRMIVGAVMIPDKYIYRSDVNGMGAGYVRFSRETISAARDAFMDNNLGNSTTREHDPDTASVTEFSLRETWIVEDSKMDKTQKYGLEYPAGTWVHMYYVNDDTVWQETKAGMYEGFSIEGYFDAVPDGYNMSEDEKPLEDKLIDIIQECFN